MNVLGTLFKVKGCHQISSYFFILNKFKRINSVPTEVIRKSVVF